MIIFIKINKTFFKHLRSPRYVLTANCQNRKGSEPRIGIWGGRGLMPFRTEEKPLKDYSSFSDLFIRLTFTKFEFNDNLMIIIK